MPCCRRLLSVRSSLPTKLPGFTPLRIATLKEWIERLRNEAGGEFPEKVTAFREEMGVHGKFGKPCPVCGTKVQRIVYAENESNYCPRCQTGGKILSDRSLARLLKDDWPKTVDELEQGESEKQLTLRR